MDFIKSLRAKTSHLSNAKSRNNDSNALPPAAAPGKNLLKCPLPKQSKTEQLKIEREMDRRNQRLNMITKCRIGNNNNTSNMKMHQHNEPAPHKNAAVCKIEDGDLNSTYVLPLNGNRRQLLSAWQKEKREKQFQKPPPRPVFKVTHVDPRMLEFSKSQSMSSLNLHSTRMNGNDSHMPHRSYLSRANSTLKDSAPTVKKQGIYYFGETAGSHSVPNFSVAASLKTEHKPLAKTPDTVIPAANIVAPKSNPKSLLKSIEVIAETINKSLSLAEAAPVPVPVAVPVVKDSPPPPPAPPAPEPLELIVEKAIIISPIKTLQAEAIENNTNDNTALTVNYYRKLVVEKTNILNSLANVWTNMYEADTTISDDHKGEIRCACGLAKLLIDERFTQFNELIDKCENTNIKCPKELDSKLVLGSDLQGFWDMINHQVVDVEKRFFNLDKLKANNWIDEYELKKLEAKSVSKNLAKLKQIKAASIDSDTKQENVKPKTSAKSKFAEFRAKMQQKQASNGDVFIEQLVEIKTVFVETKQAEVVVPEPEFKVPKRRSSIRQELKTRKSIAPVNNQILEEDCQKKKYNLRSRPSDLIKFESPRQSVSKGIFTLPNFNSTIAEPGENDVTAPKVVNIEQFDFDDEFEPVAWGVSHKSTKVVKPDKENAVTNVMFNFNSPKTPKRDVLAAQMESPKSGHQLKTISNSPLLKLALISSHGKRQSLSTGKNMHFPI